MTKFNVPARNEVSEANQAIFDNLEKQLGFVPNIFATYAHSENALGDFLTLSNRKTSLKAKEKEVVNLAVSQVNECSYCLAAHTAIGKMNKFTDEQILELRAGYASFDSKLDALAKFSRETTINRGKPSQNSIENLIAAGYTKASIIDIIILIGDKTITNYLHGITNVPVDFPAAPVLEEALV